MIYTVIAEYRRLQRVLENEMRDCRDMRQPRWLKSEEIYKYIENTKNESVKKERLCAYVTLSFSLAELFGIEDFKILRAEGGKPYIEAVASQVKISISHSEGVAAITLSDEGEVGVDIQSEVDTILAEKIKKRFFTDYRLKNDNTVSKYFECTRRSDGLSLCELSLCGDISEMGFTAVWSQCEAILKCEGGGFGSIEGLEKLTGETICETKKIELKNKTYFVSTSKKTR